MINYSSPDTVNTQNRPASYVSTTPPGDYYNPYSYADWLRRTTGIKSGYESRAYDEYLSDWHVTKYASKATAMTLKDDYITFMRTISPLIDESDAASVLKDVNWEDPLEVELVIPACARRLKEIAVYFIAKREAIRRSKLKYNMTGSTQSVERMFHEYLLKAFTKRDHAVNITDDRIYELLPDLSASNKTLKIEIEEVYDDTEYFDKNPAVSPSAYFGTPSDNAKAYYAAHGYTEDALDWLFSTGFSQLCADNPMFYLLDDALSGGFSAASAYVDSKKNVPVDYYQFRLSEKYIGTDQYWMSGGYYAPNTIDLSFNLKSGNNWIFFPSGEIYHETPTATLSALNLTAASMTGQGAVGAKNYQSADKFFVQYGDTVKGAWLYESVASANDISMIANLKANGPTHFRFPFPGYGLSGEGLSWTGPETSNEDKTIETLEDDEQRVIVSAYWDTLMSAVSTVPIDIHDTTLVSAGAAASVRYPDADRITVRIDTGPDMVHDVSPDGVYTGGTNHAWLYRFDTTDIPISPAKNYMQWPMQKYDVNDTTLLHAVPSTQCATIYLSSINTTSGIFGSRAGHDLFDSDILYKIDSRNGHPIECAFLSGYELSGIGGTSWTDHATGCVQTSLNRKVSPNSYSTFIWLDEDIAMDDVTFHIPHQPDCPYLKEPHFALDKENPSDQKAGVDYHQWQKCTCGAIRYSPLGHTGSAYDNHLGYADIVFLDRLYPIPFSKTTWQCEDFSDTTRFKNYEDAENFGWYQLTGAAPEGEVGWGGGRWVAAGNPGTDPAPFMLRKGYQYKYYRTGLGHDEQYLIDDTVPYLIIRHKHTGALLTSRRCPKWIKAVADETGSWYNVGEITNMTLSPGEYFIYDHIDSDWYCITGAGTLGEYVGENPMVPYNLGFNPYIGYTHMNVGDTTSAIWPASLVGGGPTVVRGQCTHVAWSIKMPNVEEFVQVLSPNEAVTVYGATKGTWRLGATAYGNPTADFTITSNYLDMYEVLAASSLVASAVFTDIPSGVFTSGETSVHTIYSNTISYPFNVSLSGWNYDTNVPSVSSAGARPYWAKAYSDSSPNTKNKGVSIWGGNIHLEDEYVPIIQPALSDIVLSANSYVMYETTRPIKWVQPVTVLSSIAAQEWRGLELDTEKAANLSGQISNKDFCELIVSPSDTLSDIVLTDKIDGYRVQVNYWANQDFVWTQRMNDVSNGIPPTGGTYVAVATGLLVGAEHPYANLSNRHYPSIASVPIYDKMYTKDEVGGYFVPKHLGASVALAKNRTSEFDVSRRTSADAGTTYRDIDTYLGDEGLSKTWHDSPTKTRAEDASWMKASVTSRIRAGSIIDPVRYQQFMPYKTDYEIRGRSDIGVHRQGDTHDPWTGPDAVTWADERNYPTHFTKQEPIARWRAGQIDTSNVHQWKSDLYGYQYILQKDGMFSESIYDKRSTGGHMEIRLLDGTVRELASELTCLFTDERAIGNLVIYDFDIFYDVMMIRAYGKTVMYKLEHDVSTGRLIDSVDNLHPIGGMCVDTVDNKHKCAGTWFFPNQNKVVVMHLGVLGGVFSVIVHTYDTVTGETTHAELPVDVSTCYGLLDDLDFERIEAPVVSFNDKTDTFAVSFLLKSAEYKPGFVFNLYIRTVIWTYELTKIRLVAPGKFTQSLT